VLAERYDDSVSPPSHPRGTEIGGGLPDLHTAWQLLAILGHGFTILEHRDLATESDPEMPWYEALAARRFAVGIADGAHRRPCGTVISQRVRRHITGDASHCAPATGAQGKGERIRNEGIEQRKRCR
jgi:hypothetical protein